MWSRQRDSNPRPAVYKDRWVTPSRALAVHSVIASRTCMSVATRVRCRLVEPSERCVGNGPSSPCRGTKGVVRTRFPLRFLGTSRSRGEDCHMNIATSLRCRAPPRHRTPYAVMINKVPHKCNTSGSIEASLRRYSDAESIYSTVSRQEDMLTFEKESRSLRRAYAQAC